MVPELDRPKTDSGAADREPPTDWKTLVKTQVRRRYDYLASAHDFPPDGAGRAAAHGYRSADLVTLPAPIVDAYSGSGNPLTDVDLADVRLAVDLGCGAGIDALLGSAALAHSFDDGAMLVALDFAPEMIRRLTGSTDNKTIRPMVADMEALPLAADVADLVIANASFNLCVDADRAFAEAYRILVPGGRLAAADFVRNGPLPPEAAQNPMAWNASIGGVMAENALIEALGQAGFEDIAITGHRDAPPVTAVRITAVKPN